MKGHYHSFDKRKETSLKEDTKTIGENVNAQQGKHTPTSQGSDSNSLETQKATKGKRERGIFSTRHRYWTINYYTFLILSVYCLLLPLALESTYKPSEGWIGILVLVIAAIAVILSAVGIRKVLKELINGKYSYDAVTTFWEDRVFNVTNSMPSNQAMQPIGKAGG